MTTVSGQADGPELLTMSLQRPGDPSTIPEHAVVAFPTSYADAVDAAYEVFDLGSKSIDVKGIELRRSVQHIDTKTNVWARILPREWTVVVRSHIDEVAVFLKEDEGAWKRMRGGVESEEKIPDGSGEEPRLLHLIGIDERGGKDKRFVVPMPESYEECQSVAYGLLVLSPYISIRQPTDLILKGIFGTNGNSFFGILVPSAYPLYINRPGSVEKSVYVSNW
ncbi:hypothetical protein M413DRAFT_448840 [Hebeloma cylindrosporum]|uniref:Uncharacterized protein n=1 Tax=Hebeloma cylindrosporum TaxID=76867 RepID=A0A0C2Y7B5_HEBCY|nr:hypothetical protein M413DRAFT_448840 [Hebeloma cylindrosporum h7]